MSTPWHDVNGNLKFPGRAIFDRAFIWPLLPEKFEGKEKIIYIPENLRIYFSKGEGILLSVGPGYYSDDGKWHPVTDQLKPGMKVFYDKGVPWGTYVKGLDGKKYFVVLCGAQDIKAILED